MGNTQFNKKVKVVRTGNATEFMYLTPYFLENGTFHQTTMAHAPQQNSRVEWKHYHILNVAHALLFQANLLIRFWGKCVLNVGYLINCTTTAILHGKTPFEVLFNKVPSYSLIFSFGCLAYIHDNSVENVFF